MATAHEESAAELHGELQVRAASIDKTRAVDMTGAPLPTPAVVQEAPQEQVGEIKDAKDLELQGTEDGQEPTDQEKQTLRRVGENLPWATYTIAIVELCERFTYYGAQGLFQNYINNNPDGSDGAKGLGLGHQGATGLNVFFQFFCYVTPILGAIVADQYLGRYKTIVVFCVVYFIGLLILWVTALPSSMAHHAGIGGYVAAIIVIAFGTGGIKSNIAPLIADQYTRRTMAVKTLPSGERVVIDPAVTYQRIYMVFYACINIGSLSLLATPFMEKYKGFWTAFLLCFCVFMVGTSVLILMRKSYLVRPPQGSIITQAFKALGMMITARDMDAPKPSYRAEHGKGEVPWNDHFVDELKRALRACKVFVFYPVFWVCYGQFSSNFVSQAAQMQGHGMPNDLMQNFDPISIIIFLPILDRFVYPLLRRRGWELRPILRITIGFFLAGCCLAYAAIVQKIIYDSGPCYEHPLNCPAGLVAGTTDSYVPNSVHIVVQTPAYVFIGLSEIFISVTGLEYAYTKAPPTMKSFVQSLYLFTNAFGAALNEALVPATTDPAIMWMYMGLCIAAVITSVVFWFIFHHYDSEEEKMNELDVHDTWNGKPGEESVSEDQPQQEASKETKEKEKL